MNNLDRFRHQNAPYADDFTRPSTQSRDQANHLMDRLRGCCLSIGEHGIKQAAQMFYFNDNNTDRKLPFDEFVSGLMRCGCGFTSQECQHLTLILEMDQDGRINFNDFMSKLRPTMNMQRLKLVNKAFDNIDRTGSDIVSVIDLVKAYDCTRHSKYESGEWTKTKVMTEFLNRFEGTKKNFEDYKDLKISRDDFINYYSGLSPAIYKDTYFDLLMRQSWKI